MTPILVRLLILTTWLTTFCLSGQAQKNDPFPEEESEFLSEVRKVLTSSDKKEGKALFEQLQAAWVGGLFSPDSKAQIIRTANSLSRKKARPFPHYYGFFASALALNGSIQTEDSRQNWQAYLDFLLNARTATLPKIEELFSLSSTLIGDGTAKFSASGTWVFGSDFRFAFEEPLLKVYVDSIDLVFKAREDSLLLFNTSGVMIPSEERFQGKGGKIFWERAGLPRDSVWADLGSFQLNLTRAGFTIDSVLFHNQAFSDQPIPGKLTDKVLPSVSEEKKSYPRFESYQSRFLIRNFYPGLDYDGGFSMQGAKVLGAGTQGQEAWIKVYRHDTLFLKAASTAFIFRKGLITSATAKVFIYLRGDSIFHPGLFFRYRADQNTIQASRLGEGMAKAPFFNTYHALDMDFEQLTWKIDEEKIVFGALKGGALRAAVFESVNYFSPERYEAIRMRDKENPLLLLSRFAKSINSDRFSATAYANYIAHSPSEVRQQMMMLSYLGFVSFQIEDETIIIREKLRNYLKAIAGKIDYDLMNFNSLPGDLTNAELSLLNRDLRIFGVDTLYLSNKQNVLAIPSDRRVLMKKNRDFEFRGKIEAGGFDIFGRNFSFSYNNFDVNLPDIDSMRIYTFTGKLTAEGLNEIIPIRSILQDGKGRLLIDRPMNKSGRKDFPEYPILKTTRPIYVYYDKPSIFGGVYNRADFYFQVDTFSIDSLNTFSPKALEFPGILTSADIFPEFRESLKVQKDYSLGFIRNTPDQGFPTYKGKGQYTNRIYLSNQGLRGTGNLEYLTSTAKSTEFFFFPDSTNALCQTFDIKKQIQPTEFPSASGLNVALHWLPKSDEMFLRNTEDPFRLFDREANLTGILKLEPSGLSGDGQMDFINAEMASREFNYRSSSFTSDTTSFNLKTEEKADFVFATTNVNAAVDFRTRKGTFVMNDSTAFVQFPVNQYMASMDLFTWYMDKQEIDLSVSTLTEKDKMFTSAGNPRESVDEDLDGSRFISVHPRQDSLTFTASYANYKIREQLITASNVKTIRVADVAILPGDGVVQIERKAIMRTLEEARIVADVTEKYHLLYKATVNVFGRKSYNGRGDYDYVDILNRKQVIHFHTVEPGPGFKSYALADLPDTVGFMLSPNFAYKGTVRLDAPMEFLTFTGGTRLVFDCPRINHQWLKFSAPINPQEIAIPIPEEPLDYDGNKLAASFMLVNDSAHIYSSFLDKPKKYSDNRVLPAHGFLIFDAMDQEYRIAEKSKLEDDESNGNLLVFKKNKCEVYGEGRINLGIYTGQIGIEALGNGTHDLAKDSIRFSLMLLLDAFIPSALSEFMATTLQTDPNLEASDLSAPVYTKGMSELLGRAAALEAFQDLSQKGKFSRFPDSLNKALVFSEVNLKWVSSEEAYLSEGPLSISNMGKLAINRMVDGQMEFLKKRSGNEFSILLQPGYDKWFFFNYSRNTLQIVSSMDEFNNLIKEMKEKERRNQVKGKPPLTVILASDRKAKNFIRKYALDEEPEEEPAKPDSE